MIELFANSGDPDQTSHSAASDLGLICLPNTHLGVSRVQTKWVKFNLPQKYVSRDTQTAQDLEKKKQNKKKKKKKKTRGTAKSLIRL